MSSMQQPHPQDLENEPVPYDEGDFEPPTQADPPEDDNDPDPVDDYPGPKGGGSAS